LYRENCHPNNNNNNNKTITVTVITISGKTAIGPLEVSTITSRSHEGREETKHVDSCVIHTLRMTGKMLMV
jgi:hypothetical protein